MIKIKILLLIGAMVFLIFNEVGLKKLFSLYNENKEEEKKLSQKHSEIIQLTAAINKLENDSEYQQKIARQYYKMAKPGEKIYRVENQKSIITP